MIKSARFHRIYQSLRSIYSQHQKKIWNLLITLSLLIATYSFLQLKGEFEFSDVSLTFGWIAITILIYFITYCIQIVGWHFLAKIYFNHSVFADNCEAVAQSELVKFLPTVVWHIARRTTYYEKHGIPAKQVISASIAEMIVMFSSGTFLLLFLLGINHSPFWWILIILLPLFFYQLKTTPFMTKWVQKIIVPQSTPRKHWLAVVLLYGSSWISGGVFLLSTLRIFTDVSIEWFWQILYFWLLSNVVSYLLSITIGTLSIAREAGLAILLAKHWPGSIAIAASIMVKILMTASAVLSAFLMLGLVVGYRKIYEHKK